MKTGIINGKKYYVVDCSGKADPCRLCALSETCRTIDIDIACTPQQRADKRNVIFIPYTENGDESKS